MRKSRTLIKNTDLNKLKYYDDWSVMPKMAPRNYRFRTKKYPDLVRMFEIREGLSLMSLLKKQGLVRKFRTQIVEHSEQCRYFRIWMVEPENVIQVDKTIQLWIKMKRTIKGEKYD